MNIIVVMLLLVFGCAPGASAVAAEDNHGQGGNSPSREGVVHLDSQQIKEANLMVRQVRLRRRAIVVRAPGTVKFNSYQVDDVSPLVGGIVTARHVRLGDAVEAGQKLAVLQSTVLAQAEADFLKALAAHRKSRAELQRLKPLAKQHIVSRAKLQQAESIHQADHASLAAARAILASYGLKRSEVDSRLVGQRNYGRLILRSPRDGTVVADDFRLGQHVSAGTPLLQVADEKTLWVEAKVSQTELAEIAVGQDAVVMPKNGAKRYEGEVVNIHPKLDPSTRTASVRLEVHRAGGTLRPGMFVDADIATGEGGRALLLPRRAIQSDNGKMVVFVEEKPGYYRRQVVHVGKANMGFVPVRQGLKAGDRVVVRGAFSVLSEMSKSGFSGE